MNKRFLIVIVGPTAVGKTDSSIKLAKKLETEIISCDSRQFYKEISIGTAKPSPQELAEAPHHFINSHSITEPYTVGTYEKEALELINNLFKKHTTLILTGGSGLFVKAICDGLDNMPTVPKDIRANLKDELAQNGLESLVKKLLILDPEASQTVALDNPQRVIRALEISQFTGKPFSFYHNNNSKKRPFEIIKIGIERPREELYQRINLRVDLMLKAGLVAEVDNLIEHKHLNALQTVGYKEVFEYLDNKTDYQTMVDLLKRNTRRYAKRQITWFKNQDNYRWFSPQNHKEIEEYVFSEISN